MYVFSTEIIPEFGELHDIKLRNKKAFFLPKVISSRLILIFYSLNLGLSQRRFCWSRSDYDYYDMCIYSVAIFSLKDYLPRVPKSSEVISNTNN